MCYSRGCEPSNSVQCSGDIDGNKLSMAGKGACLDVPTDQQPISSASGFRPIIGEELTRPSEFGGKSSLQLMTLFSTKTLLPTGTPDTDLPKLGIQFAVCWVGINGVTRVLLLLPGVLRVPN